MWTNLEDIFLNKCTRALHLSLELQEQAQGTQGIASYGVCITSIFDDVLVLALIQNLQ